MYLWTSVLLLKKCMNFNAIFLKSFRVLLLPFALLYGLIIIIRNFLYDKNIFRSAGFNFPVICIGNLVVGGTGKSPMVEYLGELLQPHFRMGIVSRGYKRKTKGYALADENSTALDIGDEPIQFHIKFPGIAVAVGEQRLEAIPQLLHDRPDLQAIIFDDGFQHRAVRAGLNILLTDYSDLFTRDFFLPTGNLRDNWASYKRAQIIVVTKCPETLSENQKRSITKEIKPLKNQQIFFTAIEYGEPFHIINYDTRNITDDDEVLLVCGIANPKPLKQYLLDHAGVYYMMEYRDHHIFSIDDLKEIKEKFEQINASEKLIITTEKDAVRLFKFNRELEDIPLYVLPVGHQFLFGEQDLFNEAVTGFIRDFQFNSAT